MPADRSEQEQSEAVALTREEGEVEFARVVAFSDGVFAIAITLLVLALELPDSAGDVGEALGNQASDFFAYLLSFAVLGSLWLSHHRFFSALGSFDSRLMTLNLVYLAGIALVPFSSEVFGDYSESSPALVLYAANMAAVSLAFYAQILYAYRRGLIKPKWATYERRFASPINLSIAGIFLISIPVALVAPDVAPLLWLSIFLLGRRTLDRLAGVNSP